MQRDREFSAKFWRSEWAGLSLLMAVVLLSRIPFLSAGYGTQMDGWRVANTARQLAETGTYEVSRFPGFPVHEIACSLFWKGGPSALNGASAIFGAVAVGLLALIARRMGCKDCLLAGLALAFAPVFYINCVSAKDYTWGLAFTLASLYLIIKNRPLTAGICLGFAIGCRLTAAVAILPLSIILAGDTAKNRVRQFLVFGVAFAVTTIVVFLPVIAKYGAGFLTTYIHAYPDWRTLLGRASLEVWGATGLAGICLAVAGAFWKIKHPKSAPSFTCPPYHVNGWIAAVVVYTVVFFSHPDLAGYLIPLIPFVILLLARFTPRRTFQIFCLLAMMGSFITIDRHGLTAGPIVQDHRERLTTAESIRNFLSFTKQMPGKNAFVVGGWEPEIKNIFPASEHPDQDYFYLLTAPEVIQFIKSGTPVYYNSPAIREFNYRVNGIDLAKYGARDLHAIYDKQLRSEKGSAPK